MRFPTQGSSERGSGALPRIIADAWQRSESGDFAAFSARGRVMEHVQLLWVRAL